MSFDKDNEYNDHFDFDKVFNDHFDYLVNFAYQYVKDSFAAEDICQKVLIKLWENRKGIDPNRSIKSYLFTAVRNRCLNYIRDNSNRLHKTLDIDSAAFVHTDFSNVPEYDELKAIIDKAVDDLPLSCKQTFIMSRIDGKKYKEIAEELGISQKTVESHISKALKQLRFGLKDYISIIIALLYWIDR